ncbi:MAG: SOS response-associated peptidase [Anaerolineales bacterium]|nr:SOS response-associated peptidase [Anaerolineales bacterium]
MCGRFTLTADPEQLRQAFSWLGISHDTTPRYNIAPTQPVAVVPNDGKNQLDYYLWGLIPSWAKDPQIGSRMINARAETLAEKPSFRSAFRRRRCLILADGFFEWQQVPGRKAKLPMYIQLNSQQPFAFAGLWESWHSPDGLRILSCTIITTQPNELMQGIHNRMPVILPPEAYPLWLDPGEPAASALQELLRPYPAGEMQARPVSYQVNNPANDSPECLAPNEQ